MANEPVYSDKGIYFDMKAMKIVEGPPEEGVQIVAPGGVIDADAEMTIGLYGKPADDTAEKPAARSTRK